MGEIQVLKSGITMEGEAIMGEGGEWFAAVRLRGVDAQYRPFALTLGVDDLDALGLVARANLKEFIAKAEEPPVS